VDSADYPLRKSVSTPGKLTFDAQTDADIDQQYSVIVKVVVGGSEIAES
jgi:hypothetical protein